jgi:hypothetical protein
MHTLLLKFEEAFEFLGRCGEGGRFFAVHGRRWWRRGNVEVGKRRHRQFTKALALGCAW